MSTAFHVLKKKIISDVTMYDVADLFDNSCPSEEFDN